MDNEANVREVTTFQRLKKSRIKVNSVAAFSDPEYVVYIPNVEDRIYWYFQVSSVLSKHDILVHWIPSNRLSGSIRYFV